MRGRRHDGIEKGWRGDHERNESIRRVGVRERKEEVNGWGRDRKSNEDIGRG